MSYSIVGVDRADIQDVISYIRWRLPGMHFKATDAQLRLLTIRLLDQDGMLDPSDSEILHTPFIGRLLTTAGGDPFEASVHFLVDALPVIGDLSIIGRL